MAIKSVLIAALATISAATPITNNNLETRQSGNIITTIDATTTSLWNSGSSTVNYNSGYGLVQRYPGTLNEFSTLLTYSIPSTYASNTCQLIFSLSSASGSHASGTQNAQIFFDQKAAAPGARSDFRDTQIANIKAVNGGLATWAFTDGRSTGKTSWTVPCADLIKRPYLEVAPQGESDYIYWTLGDGLKVQVLNA